MIDHFGWSLHPLFKDSLVKKVLVGVDIQYKIIKLLGSNFHAINITNNELFFMEFHPIPNDRTFWFDF